MRYVVKLALSDIAIKCSCGKASTMKGSFSKNGLRGITKCKGRRPWLQDNVECIETPRTLQRGASNAYFSVTQSALSIPPFSQAVFTALNPYWSVIKNLPNDALLAFMQNFAEHTEFTPEQLVKAVKHLCDVESGEEAAPDERSLKAQEYEALVEGKAETSAKEEFVCVPAKSADEVGDWFSRVMLVTRLREVRAQTAFTRLMPAGQNDPPERLAKLSAVPMTWLPAIEVMGEGVFIQLNENRLQEWESQDGVKARAAKVNRNYARSFGAQNQAPDTEITARFMLMHTLAHVMITQWSLECGYPSASLRERLYAEDEMAGFLIYTAGSDSAGSLGGLVAQADKSRLWISLFEAIARTAWCSADPLCIEADASGVDSLNLAACHACVLLPETSCEWSNRLLDRAMLTGTGEKPYLGFFTGLLEGAE